MMSPTIIIGIIVIAILGILILRQSFRKKVAESIPHVTYVDETLLDLIRTKQRSSAIRYYQERANVTSEEAETVIYYLMGREEALMLLVRLQEDNNVNLFTDDALLDYVKQGRLSKAALYYSDQTGADPREAQIAISAIVVNPEMDFLPRRDVNS